MEPVLSTFEATQIVAMLHDRFRSRLGDRQFVVTANRDDRFVYFTATLSNADQSFFYPVEVRTRLVARDMVEVRRSLDALVFFACEYWDEFLADEGDVFLPIDWASYEVDGTALEARGQIRNLKLERAADAWLEQAAGQSLS